MPELAEVAFACSKWDAGVGKKVFGVYTHPTSRVYRDERRDCFVEYLQNSTLLSSYTHGKQMLFKFSGNIFIGIHLGMTGNLILGAKNYKQQKHDALVIIQSQNSLVFQDPRQFGRIRIHKGKNLPSWWRNLPPSIIEKKFNSEILESAIFRHRRKPIKALLLDQRYFPGIGNWMADEILWRSMLNPGKLCEKITESEIKKLFNEILFVARGAMKSIGVKGGDPPKNWLFHKRWNNGNLCPKTKTALVRETIGGRTTCWAPAIQC